MVPIGKKQPLIRSGSRAVQKTERILNDYPAYIYTVFYIFSAYLVLPLWDIPLLGLSISAPLFFMITVAVVFNPPTPWFRQNRAWIFLTLAIFFGIVLSTLLNGLIAFGDKYDSDGTKALIQYAYWLIVFLITSQFCAQKGVLKQVHTIFAWSVFLLALLRWGEGIFLGKWGAGNNPTILTQNSYGFQFSTFSPFLLIKVFETRKSKRLLWFLALFLCWGAAAINGSRGSWVAIVVGTLVCIFLFLISNPSKFANLILVIMFVAIIGVGLLSSVPVIQSAIQVRLNTFQTLEEDRPFVIRQVLTQKGLSLFEESPIIGVGATRFTKSWVELNIPELLSSRADEMQMKTSHNSYVQWLAEFGLLGSITFGILLITLLIKGFLITRQEITNDNLIPLSLFLSFIQMSVHMWVIAALTGTLCWFIYGLNVASIKRFSHQEKQ